MEDRLTTMTIDGMITMNQPTKTTLAMAEKKVETPQAMEVGENLLAPVARAEALMDGKIPESLVITEARDGTPKVTLKAIPIRDSMKMEDAMRLGITKDPVPAASEETCLLKEISVNLEFQATAMIFHPEIKVDVLLAIGTHLPETCGVPTAVAEAAAVLTDGPTDSAVNRVD